MTKVFVNKLLRSHAIVYPALLAAFTMGTLMAAFLPQAFKSPAAETESAVSSPASDAELPADLDTNGREVVHLP